MYRVQYSWFGGPDVLRVVDAPVPQPDDNDVLVKVRAASINPTDANKRSGALRVLYLRELRPYRMRMDVAGEVVVIGEAVPGVKVGGSRTRHDKRRRRLRRADPSPRGRCCSVRARDSLFPSSSNRDVRQYRVGAPRSRKSASRFTSAGQRCR